MIGRIIEAEWSMSAKQILEQGPVLVMAVAVEGEPVFGVCTGYWDGPGLCPKSHVSHGVQYEACSYRE